MKKISPFLFICILVLSQTACKDDDNCDDKICTLEFKIITVEITDKDKNPVVLDSLAVINLENGENITTSYDFQKEKGIYPMLTDGQVKPNINSELFFNGFINSKEVVSQTFVATSDCCHIKLVSGNRELQID